MRNMNDKCAICTSFNPLSILALLNFKTITVRYMNDLRVPPDLLFNPFIGEVRYNKINSQYNRIVINILL